MQMMFRNFIKSLDIYGHVVGVHYRGDSSFKTGFGAVLSLISFTLIIINTTGLASSFVSKSDQKESMRTITESLVNVDVQNLKENELDIAFTIGS